MLQKTYLDSRLVAAKLSFQALMLLPQVLDTSQVSAVVIGGDEKFLLLDPGLFIRDISEELVQSQGFVETRLPMGRQVSNLLVSVKIKSKNVNYTTKISINSNHLFYMMHKLSMINIYSFNHKHAS